MIISHSEYETIVTPEGPRACAARARDRARDAVAATYSAGSARELERA